MLSRIKDDAVNRRREREEREARETEEAEELRQILAQIEEYEREEALKAEMLRQEQQRLEEERRQRELEERVRQESIRRRDVEFKFTELRRGLDLLHEMQQVILEENLETVSKSLAEEMQKAKRELEEKQTQERADLEAHIQVKMSEKEVVFNEDFTVRSAAEKKVVDEYQNQLQAYWRDKTGAEQEIDTAMAPLRERMERHCLAWQQWKDKELKAYRERLEERRSMREEFMYSAKARLGDQCENRETDLVRRVVAEHKWMQMVMLERESLLAEMEVDEMEGDADSLFAGDNENSDGTDAAGEEQEQEQQQEQQEEPHAAAEGEDVGRAM